MADVTAIVTDPSANSIYVVDLTTQTILTTLSVTTPGAIAVLPDSSQAYVTNNGGGTGVLYPVNLPANTLGTSISVVTAPLTVAASPDGTHVYAASGSSGNITPVATPSNVAGAPIVSGGGSVGGLAVDPASANLYASSFGTGVFPIAIPANTVGAGWGNPPLPNNVGGLVVMPDNIHGYIAAPSAGAVYPLNFVAQTVSGPITTTASFPDFPFLQPGGAQLFVPDGGANQVIVIDTSSNTQVAAIPITAAGQSGGFDSTGAHFYVPTISGGTIQTIDTATHAVTSTWAIGGNPRFIAIIPTVAATAQIVMVI